LPNLADLLKKLGEDAALEESYRKDPEAVMDQFDLGDEEREALRSGDIEKLKRMTGLSVMSISNGTVTSYDT
jgi:predicted DNA-binding protein (UPF0251 family)